MSGATTLPSGNVGKQTCLPEIPEAAVSVALPVRFDIIQRQT